MESCGTVTAVCLSDKKGVAKREAAFGTLVEAHGLLGDAHAGSGHRQVSLLSCEKVREFRARGGKAENGAFGENLLVTGIDLARLAPGALLRVGAALLQVSQIGKECRAGCTIMRETGECIMPREGVFARVLRGGNVAKGDAVYVEDPLPGGHTDGQ